MVDQSTNTEAPYPDIQTQNTSPIIRLDNTWKSMPSSLLSNKLSRSSNQTLVSIDSHPLKTWQPAETQHNDSFERLVEAEKHPATQISLERQEFYTKQIKHIQRPFKHHVFDSIKPKVLYFKYFIKKPPKPKKSISDYSSNN